MRLAIYRKGGEITSVNSIDHIADCDEKAKHYNEKYADKGMSVSIHEYAEGDVVPFLFNDRKLKKEEFRNDLLNIYSATEDISNQLRWLEDTLKDMEEL